MERMKTIMTTMIECHDALYALAVEKTEAVKGGNAPALSEITKKESPLVEKLRALEKERSAIVEADLGDDGAGATFAEWEQAVVEEKERGDWQRIYLDLANSVYALKQVNTLNQELLRDSLLWVKLNMGLLRPKTHTLNNYQNPRDGQAPSSVFSGRIDSRT
ncbi:flagellar protein FlgN [Sporolactobacillus nakayamae]|uniref:flagellar protein FlgN n=1 Tax=Sporolactobacillus nakayamae TaxID=269670 RepID=UPI001FDEDFB7|nr:flagellar protein FlgN [Sporolactobacillus nakayamae]